MIEIKIDKTKYWIDIMNYRFLTTENTELIISTFCSSLKKILDFLLKFRYYEKATKFGWSSSLYLTKKWKMNQNFVAFSEYLNFNTLYLAYFQVLGPCPSSIWELWASTSLDGSHCSWMGCRWGERRASCLPSGHSRWSFRLYKGK